MLSNEQKEELKKIVAYPASFGAFTGMIFNQLMTHSPKPEIEYLIKEALNVKLKAKELAQ